MSQLTALAKVFLKLGVTAFGGSAAHVAAIQTEVVDRRQWISRERLLELYASTSYSKTRLPPLHWDVGRVGNADCFDSEGNARFDSGILAPQQSDLLPLLDYNKDSF